LYLVLPLKSSSDAPHLRRIRECAARARDDKLRVMRYGLLRRGAPRNDGERVSVARMEPTGRANARPMTGSAKSGAATRDSRIALRSIRATGLRRTSRLICPTGKSAGSLVVRLSSPICKNISLRPSGKSLLQLPPSCPTEGRCATSSTRGGMRWTRAALVDERC